MAEQQFSKGFFFKRPHENAPDWVKGRLSIKTEDAIPFLQETKNEDGFVNLDLLLSKDGEKLYFTVNNYKPDTKKDFGL